jgi:Fe-S oxidoreductase
MAYAEILHRCFRCGFCKFPSDYSDINCPAYLKYRFETFSPGGRMWLLRAWLNREIPSSPRLAEIFYSCTACGNCVEHCAFPDFRENLLNAFIEGKSELVDQNVLPPKVRDYFESIYRHGNPFKFLKKNRAAWADGLNLDSFSGQTYLFYVGCAGSYDEYGKKMAFHVARLLTSLGISLGILGENEYCDGNEIHSMGEAELFRHIAEQNIRQFKDAGVENIITLSPHAYHAFKNDYPSMGGDFNVFHYSRVLRDTLNEKEKIATKRPLKITFHDPCYLGRHNNDYSSAREVLQRIAGLELLEMDRVMNNALCCGGGGGNFHTDILGGGPDSAARVRVREALQTGAEILAVVCPKCLLMFKDAVQSEGVGEKIQVMDPAEIILSFE